MPEPADDHWITDALIEAVLGDPPEPSTAPETPVAPDTTVAPEAGLDSSVLERLERDGVRGNFHSNKWIGSLGP